MNVQNVLADLLSPNVQNFIMQHENADVKEIVLKQRTLFDIPVIIIAHQISGKKKARTKLPEFYATPNIIYPAGKNLEQSSSEKAAKFKAMAITGHVEKTSQLIDLTGGFGVDSYYLSRVFKSVTYIESDEMLFEIARHNHGTLNATNINHVLGSAERILESTNQKADVVYIDPSRRTSENKRVSFFENSEPNVLQLTEKIFSMAKTLVIKASPLLDIKSGLESLQNTSVVWILSIDNDCKELLFFVDRTFTESAQIKTVNITLNGEEQFDFTYKEERFAEVSYSPPLKFIYEPNVAVLKAGAFKLIANKFGLKKLHPNSHLYTSDTLRKDFPGRIFNFNSFVKSDPKSAREFYRDGQANIIVRNYPLSVAELKKKLKLIEGGQDYLFGTTGPREKHLFSASRIK